MQLSTQITSFTISGQFVNSTVPDITSPPFQKPQYAVYVNTLWFLSLVIALITASLGILVKQWLRELLSYKTHDPKARLKLRFFREAGLERWKVFAIASSLPLLLQLALLLFFIGLGLFLHQQDPIVAWVTTGAMALWLAVFLFTIIMPMFSSQCPYKIPMLNTLSHWIRAIYNRIQHGTLSNLRSLSKCLWLRSSKGSRFAELVKSSRDSLDAVSWLAYAFEEDEISQNMSLDAPVVIYAAIDVLRGERLNDSIVACFASDTIAKAKCKSESKLQDRGSSLAIPYSAFFGVPEGSAQVDNFALAAFQDHSLRSGLLGRDVNPYLLAMLYQGLARSTSKAYDLSQDYPIPSQSLSAFICLIQTSSTLAAFSLLTMYSIRHRVLIDHPNTFDPFLSRLSEFDRCSHGIGESIITPLCYPG